DVPALAADHATSPGVLLGRWLRRRGDDDRPPAPNSGDPDTSCDDPGRRLADFFTAVNGLEAGTLGWEKAQRALAAADPAHVCLATHDETQYRLPEVAALAAPFSPQPNSLRS